MQQSAKREALYAEFIIEASNRAAEAWSRQADGPAAVAALYSAVGRVRLTSSPEVIIANDEVIRQIVESYAAPDKSFDDLRRRGLCPIRGVLWRHGTAQIGYRSSARAPR